VAGEERQPIIGAQFDLAVINHQLGLLPGECDDFSLLNAGTGGCEELSSDNSHIAPSFPGTVLDSFVYSEH
jgi:hypothetical protein